MLKYNTSTKRIDLVVSIKFGTLSVSRKKLDTEIKIKLNRKRLYPSQSVRYLGIKIDQNLNWKDHINDIAVKLNRANALLFKIRNFVNIIILKTIYFAIFDSLIDYANLVWAQNVKMSTLKMCFWSVILSIVSCHQSLTTGSLFALIFITMRQLHLLLLNYLNFPHELVWKKFNYSKCYWRLE